jgi:phosphoglycolate phosphatase
MNNKYDVYFWDLDGTISNSQEGIFNSILYSVQKLGLKKPSLDTLRSFIGPPLYESYMKNWFPNDKDSAQEAVRLYREYYTEKGVFQNEVYPGIKYLIQTLSLHGAKHFIATAKPTLYAEIVIDHSGIKDQFIEVFGSHLDGSRSSKIEIIRDIFLTYPELKSKKCVMIGDRYYDLLGANHHNIDGIGVLYGFGSHEELSKEDPKGLANNSKELRGLL